MFSFQPVVANSDPAAETQSTESADDGGNKPCPAVKWSDKCRYACQICFAVVQSKNILKWHVHNEHNMYENYYYEHFASDVLYKVTHEKN